MKTYYSFRKGLASHAGLWIFLILISVLAPSIALVALIIAALLAADYLLTIRVAYLNKNQLTIPKKRMYEFRPNTYSMITKDRWSEMLYNIEVKNIANVELLPAIQRGKVNRYAWNDAYRERYNWLWKSKAVCITLKEPLEFVRRYALVSSAPPIKKVYVTINNPQAFIKDIKKRIS